MNLVIVESPTKAKTLSKFLGKDYEVLASMGHVRDLPKSELGIDVDKDFAPKYVINPRAKKVLAAIKAKVKQADKIFLATDPDREGEAIAWHIASALAKELKGKKSYRVVFHEITKDAVKDAFLRTRDLDEHLVDSQQARRILDRIVGYKLSPLLWKKVRYGLSAGRVQSVAVKLVVDREFERKNFVPKEYWIIKGVFSVLQGLKGAENTQRTKSGRKSELQQPLNFEADLFQIKGNKVEIEDKGKVDEIIKDLGFERKASVSAVAGKDFGAVESIKSEESSKVFTITSVEKSQKKRNTYPPYTTSTLQQAGSNKLGFAAKRTMSAAQKLFEGGYITYHRTDSFSLSSAFIDQARQFIAKEYGKDYLPQSPNYYKNRAKNAQEAHEAIRPTSLNVHVDGDLGSDEKKLYKLIWQRALASQMNPAISDQISVLVISEDKKYTFKTVGSTTKFDGWLVLYKSKEAESKKDLEASMENQANDLEMENGVNGDAKDGFTAGVVGDGSGNESKVLNLLKEGDAASLKSLTPTQHFTEPLPRYTEASLIKDLEEDGIGRPSTYAPTMSTITDRGYITKDGKYLVPQDVAVVTTKLLSENFPKIVDVGFTALMEEGLDKIADGKEGWKPLIKNFYEPFILKIKEKDGELKKKDMTLLEELTDKCPECGSGLFVKLGKYGRFISCSGFPKCKYAKPIVSASNAGSNTGSRGTLQGSPSGDFDITQLGKCTECKEGDLLVKDGRFGRFIACSNYPKCKFTKPYIERIGVKCPDCKEGDVIVKKGGRFKKTFYACSRYPECKFVASTIPSLP